MNSVWRDIVILVSLCPFSLVFSEELIQSVLVEKNKVTVVINSDFKERYLKDDFFVEYGEDVDLSMLDYSITTMPCIMNILSLVWFSGKRYFIESIDSDLFHSLARLKKLFQITYPRTQWDGELIARAIVVNTPSLKVTSDQRALLFSGGLDSTTTSFFHNDKKQLLITAWGQVDLPLNDPTTWSLVKERLVAYAQLRGHTSAFIRSNYFDFLNRYTLNRLSDEIFNWRIETIEDIGWAGLTAPLLFLKGHSVLSIASSDTWDTPYPSAASPFVDGIITCAGIRFEHEQFDLTRAEKVEYLVTLCKNKNIEKPFLKVCSKQTGHNCGECKKCLTTILMLFALKEDPQQYGFFIEKDIALKNAKCLLNGIFKKGSLSLVELELFYVIQKKLKQLNMGGKKGDADFGFLFNFDFQEELLLTKEFKFQKRVLWDELHALFPSIKIPPHYIFKKKV
ncbi:hypothetical protein H0X06_02670 [Candidatus Dependentiae bacterium]|nr:hypothetical protein [Candidatus Dependentiae bacterium]